MRSISIQEFEKDPKACIAKAEAGQRLILVRSGKPVAEIVPYTGSKPDAKCEAARKQLLSIMDQGLDLGGKSSTYKERHAR
jgi:antitoxin (DNA-binding transcriptional repressor) of toxin-antitoxin stability system